MFVQSWPPDVEQLKFPLEGMSHGTTTLANSLAGFYKVNTHLPLWDPIFYSEIFAQEKQKLMAMKDFDINALGYDHSTPRPLPQQGVKANVHRKVCAQRFIAASFVIVQNWKQLRCPSAGERIDTVKHIQTAEH